MLYDVALAFPLRADSVGGAHLLKVARDMGSHAFSEERDLEFICQHAACVV